jgi:hypothetical protein
MKKTKQITPAELTKSCVDVEFARGSQAKDIVGVLSALHGVTRRAVRRQLRKAGLEV